MPSTASGLRFQAILFDLDGTLIDSVPDLQHAINGLLAEEGRRPLELFEVIAMVGDGAGALVERAFRATGPALDDPAPFVRRYLERYEGAIARLTRPYPGVPETLEGLRRRGHRLAVVTNKPHGATMDVLGKLELLAFFDAVVGAEDTLARKPDPAPVLAALGRLSVPPDRAVMVGDHHNDIACARSAGVPTVAVAWGYTRGRPEDLGADLLIRAFPELPHALERLSG